MISKKQQVSIVESGSAFQMNRVFFLQNGYHEKDIQDYFSALQYFRDNFHRRELQAPEPSAYYLKATDGIHVYIQEFIPKNPKIILICQHGNSCQADLYYPLADHLYSKGIGVIAIDNRGHGRTGPHRGDLDKPDLMNPIYDYVIKKYATLPVHFL